MKSGFMKVLCLVPLTGLFVSVAAQSGAMRVAGIVKDQSGAKAEEKKAASDAKAISSGAENREGQAGSSASKPAPELYVTEKFGLVMKVPAGLSFCPLPEGWSGIEEGTVLFLEPPSRCLTPGGSSITRPVDGFVPSISLRYHVNRSRDDAYDGTIPRPRTSEEFADQFCAAPVVFPDTKLFDRPAFACRAVLSANRVQIAVMAVYDSARSNLILILVTTPDRLADDQRILATLASSITACSSSSEKGKREAAVCPKGNWW